MLHCCVVHWFVACWCVFVFVCVVCIVCELRGVLLFRYVMCCGVRGCAFVMLCCWFGLGCSIVVVLVWVWFWFGCVGVGCVWFVCFRFVCVTCVLV